MVFQAAQAVHVLAIGVHAGVVDEAAIGREADLVDAAPLLVQQVAEVQDVDREGSLVVLHEARQFLTHAHVKVVDPAAMAFVAVHHAALGRPQGLVRIDDLPEACFFSRATAEADFATALRGRDVHQVVAADAVAVQVVQVGPAVGLAAATFVEHAHAGAVAAEEGL